MTGRGSGARRWAVARPEPSAVRRLAHALGVSPFLATLLVNRGVPDPGLAGRFLDPRLKDLTPPTLLKGMAQATARLVAAIEARERVVVYGDYDVDGVTSVSLLATFFREHDAPLTYFIPNRIRDGYGLSVERVEQIAADGARLVVAVDCGVTAVEEVARANALGLDVIVVDHHRPAATLPDACALINPLQDGCAFPFDGMAACGLTFYLLAALRAALRERGAYRSRPEPDLRAYLDLAALGTLADMVPLQGENRILAARGLEQLHRGPRPGIAALREVAGLGGQPLDTSAVAFQLAPRLNAAGRLGDAGLAVRLLTAEDPLEARALAARLDEANQQRKMLEKRAFAEAVELVERENAARDGAIVLASERWHPGVIGIVAAKLVERYGQPALLIALDEPGGTGRGSARSVPGFDLYAALSGCADLLAGFGGHAGAAGVTVGAAAVPALRARLCEAVAHGLEEAAPPLAIDAELLLPEVNERFVRELGRLDPYGAANPEPIVVSRAVQVEAARVVGRDHLQLRLRQDRTSHDAIAFRMAHRRPEVGSRVDVAFRPELDWWRGRERLRLRVADLRGAE